MLNVIFYWVINVQGLHKFCLKGKIIKFENADFIFHMIVNYAANFSKLFHEKKSIYLMQKHNFIRTDIL